MSDIPFPYLLEATSRCGTTFVENRSDLKGAIGRLTQKDISTFEQAFNEMIERDDLPNVLRWLRGSTDEQTSQSRQLVCFLMLLFDELGSRGIKPFSSRRTNVQDISACLDWSILPPRLQYLSSPAMRYGTIQFINDIQDFYYTMSESERSELRLLAVRIATDADDIEAFHDRYRMTEHKESELVYFLTNLIAACNL